MNRRGFLKKGFLGAVGFGVVNGLYAWQIEPFWLEFVHRKMLIKNLPPSLIGKTLMQISDIHVSNRFDYQHIIGSYEAAKQFQPDFVVYTGDYITYDSDEQLAQLARVMKTAVKGKLGTVGILGNHDYGMGWSDNRVAEGVCQILHSNGINVLRNDQINLHDLNIIGLDDYWSLNFAPESILPKMDLSKANIVLCHNPDACDLDIWGAYEGWILAGHTHGGQVKPPFLPPPIIPVENPLYTSGEIALTEGRRLYINRALGHLRQLRYNVRPEITIFELASG